MRQFFSKTALIVALFLPFFVQSQNLTGIWQGTVRQVVGEAATEFSCTLYIVQTGDQLTGTSWSYLELKPCFSEKKFAATKSGSLISFQENEILGENAAENGPFWGLSYGNLRHDPETDELTGELVFPKNSPVASTDNAQPEDFLRATIRLFR